MSILLGLFLSSLALTAPSKPLHVPLLGANGQSVGEAILTQAKEGVKFSVRLTNATAGVHAFHVHENGTCTAPDFQSAGPHYAPVQKSHGQVPGGPHEGDLPSIKVGKDGKGRAEFLNKRLALSEGSLLKPGGTSLVLHAKPDDHVSQPAGDSGDRIACGVVKR